MVSMTDIVHNDEEQTFRQIRGLWGLSLLAVPRRVLGIPVVLVLWDFAVTACLLTCTIISIHRTSSHRRSTLRVLHLGMGLLCLWFLFHSIDLAIHEHGRLVQSGYIFATSVAGILRTLSDILLILGLALTNAREYALNVMDFCALGGQQFITVGSLLCLMWVVGWLKAGMEIWLSIAWLEAADLSTIAVIAKSHSALDAAFTTIQFFAVWCPVFLVHDVDPWFLTGRDINRRANSDLAGCSSSLLFLRSFVELVIAGHTDRWPRRLQDILKARDVCYGLGSVTVFIAIASYTPDEERDILAENAREGEKQRIEKERNEAALEAKELEEHQAAKDALAKWLPEFEKAVVAKISDSTSRGRKTAPPIAQILNELGDEIEAEARARPVAGPIVDARGNRYDGPLRESMIVKAKLEQVSLMQGWFKDWESIVKLETVRSS